MLIADEVQQSGNGDNVLLCLREVVKRAHELGALALVVVQKQSPGYPKHHEGAIKITRRVKAAWEKVSIVINDHIAIGSRKRKILACVNDL